MAAASASLPSTITCNARTKQGGVCKKPAGAGTEHRGIGRCKFHGGKSPTGNVNAARLEAARLGAELDLHPHDAILRMVRRAAAAEAFWAGKVAGLADGSEIVRRVRTRDWTDGHETVTEAHSDIHVYVREHQRSIDQLARVAKTALDAGVDERRVRLAEQLVGDFADAIDLLLTRLGVRDHPDAPEAVRAALHVLETPKQLEAA